MTKRKPTWIYLAGTATLCASLALSGCFSSDDDDDNGAVGQYKATEISYDSEETFNPSVGFFTADDGGLGIRVSGVQVDDEVHKPDVTNVQIQEGDALLPPGTAGAPLAESSPEGLTCEDVPLGSAGRGDFYDIAVSLDTTGSMGGAAGVFADRIVDFADELADLDVRFTGITLGDAYATMRPEGETDYTDSISRGTLGEPPDFDSVERPDTGLDLISPNDMQEFFNEVSDVVGTGAGGGDIPENFLGPIDFLNKEMAWREDAGRVFIAIGDACSHTQETMGPGTSFDLDETSNWWPPNTDELESELSSDGVRVDIIWEQNGLSCSGDFYAMDNLSDATGGAFTEIDGCLTPEDCDVELTEIPAVKAITTERTTRACAVDTDAHTFTLTFDVEAAGKTWGVTAVIERG